VTHLVLYDGVCGLCDRFVQFLLRIDRTDQLRFAALQGAIGAEILKRHGRENDALSTVLLARDYPSGTSELLERSDAALFAIASTGGIYRAVNLFRVVPRGLRDAIYRFVAARRHRMFAKLDACPVPKPETRAKFLDLVVPARSR
jgi:predicted DCC family thiol-disulfide oxidoreductase YuxK